MLVGERGVVAGSLINEEKSYGYSKIVTLLDGAGER